MQGIDISWVLIEYLAIKRGRFIKLIFLMKREGFLKHGTGPLWGRSLNHSAGGRVFRNSTRCGFQIAARKCV